MRQTFYIEHLANFFLLFSNEIFLISLIFIGFALSPKLTLVPTLLFFFTMIFNPLLKAFFNIPFPPELVARLGRNGFSFPSGHMQSACVFYGWFLVNNKSRLIRSILVIVIIGNGFGIIYNRYHNIYDILAAIFFAFSTIGSYKIISYQLQRKKISFNLKKLSNPLITPAILIFGLSCLSFIIMGYFYKIPIHSTMALYSVLGIIIGLRIKAELEKSEAKSYQFILVVGCSILVGYLIFRLQLDSFFLQKLHSIPIATALPLLCNCLKNFKKK